VGFVAVRNGGVQAHGAPGQMVDRADLEPPAVAAQKAGLLALVARRAAAHHRSLREHARAAVGVRALFSPKEKKKQEGRNSDMILKH